MNEVFKSFFRKFTLVFFDDILIYSKDLEEHVKHLRSVFEVVRKQQLCAKLSFLGLTGYYRRFIKAYASISRPLTLLLKKNIFKWNAEAQQAFEQLKQAIISALVLALPDFEKEFIVEIDASGVDHFGLKYLLDQRIATPTQMKWLPKLMGFDYEIMFQKGVENVSVDAFVKNSYVWANEQLRRKGKLVVGKNEAVRTELFNHFHGSPVGGHPLPIPNTVWSSISIDFVQGLPKSQGKDVIMVVVDRLSKYSDFISLAHAFNATQIAQVFLDNIYKLHGMPESIVSDRDKVFISTFWKELFKLLHVKLLMSTAYHPHIDGQTEVVNRSLECYLRSLNTTPYEILYGQTPPIHIPYVNGESRVDTVDKTLTAREEVIQALKFHLKRSQERMKTQTDKHRSEREFAVKDWVYLKLQPHRQVSMRMANFSKLAPKYYRPFQVQAKVGTVAYKLALLVQAQIHDVFHAQPVAILDRRLGKVGNAGVFILVQWANSDPADAT
ncbi:putative mitochondrial protein [Tanacetum coccineum]